jgi:hypothetical protein
MEIDRSQSNLQHQTTSEIPTVSEQQLSPDSNRYAMHLRLHRDPKMLHCTSSVATLYLCCPPTASPSTNILSTMFDGIKSPVQYLSANAMCLSDRVRSSLPHGRWRRCVGLNLSGSWTTVVFSLVEPNLFEERNHIWRRSVVSPEKE